MKDKNKATPPRPREEDYNLGDIAAGYFQRDVEAWEKANFRDDPPAKYEEFFENEETEESRGGPEAISDALLNADERIDEHQYKELKRIDNRVEDEDIPGLKGLTFAEQKDVYSIDVTKLKTIRDIRKFILSLNLVFSDPTENMKEYLKKH